MRADGTVDPAFDPAPFSFSGQASIAGMTLAGGVLYIVGDIRGVGPGIARDGVAALDPATGALLPFNPQFVGSPTSIAVVAGKVFVGGEFSSVDDASRNSIAAFDATTGVCSCRGTPARTAASVTIVADGTQLLVGGFFNRIGGAARPGLAALDPTTALATSWAPASRLTEARLIATDADTVYVWGREERRRPPRDPAQRRRAALVGGGVVRRGARGRRRPRPGRRRPAACVTYDAATGATARLATRSRAGGRRRSHRALTGCCWAGRFATVGGVAPPLVRRDRPADRPASPPPRLTRPGRASSASLFRVDGRRVYLAGTFTRIDGQRRLRIAALDSAAAAARRGRPSANRDVGRHRVGRRARDRVGPVRRERRATVPGVQRADRPAGRRLGHATTPTRRSAILRVDSGRLYADRVLRVDGRPRSSSPCRTGHRVRFLVKTDRRRSEIHDLAFVGHRAYIGGAFSGSTAKPRGRTGGDLAPGRALTSWKPTVNGAVTDLAAATDAVYVTGRVQHGRGRSAHDLAAFDPRTGTVLPWAPVLPG